MIDSYLERDRKAIIIDRLLINKDSPDQYLELSPENIKKHTATHFQTVAGSNNREVTDETTSEFNPVWNDWRPFYNPSDDIDSNIYNDLVTIPSVNEWHNIIKHLPDHKAAGPSQISNEMLKKLGPKMKNFLYNIICAYLISLYTPSQ
jgi:hypothetical protein